jgi:hypothetical protein
MATSPYQHPLKHYAAVYGVSYRTILRWAEKALPLDDASQTRLATGKAGKAGNAPQGASRTCSGLLGLAASIQRLRQAEEAAHYDYQQAKTESDAFTTAQRWKIWKEISEQLRKVELATPDVAEANKSSVSISEVQTALNELFAKLRQDLETLPRRLSLELIGKDEIGIREVLARETNEIILSLFNCKYLQGGGDAKS